MLAGMDDGATPWWSVPRLGVTVLALLANATAQLVPGPVWQQHPPIGSFATALVTHGAIAQTLLLPLPTTPSFAGVLFALQAFVLDPAAANGFGSVSNAVLGIAR